MTRKSVKDQHNGRMQTWQQTKSENTRTTILDAAISCFYDVGYSNTTTEKIAKQAGVSRGAMLHHFPNRFALIKAAVNHLNRKRIELFAKEEEQIQSGAAHSRIDEGIDVYWKQLNSPLFVVFHELQVASRRDEELRNILLPAIQEYEGAFLSMIERIFPDLSQSKQFDRANLLTKFLLEGMAVNVFARKDDNWLKSTEIMLADLKTRLGEMFADVATVDRLTTKPRRRKNEP